MSKEEQARYLIQSLIKDMPEYGGVEIPEGEAEQCASLICFLTDVRRPGPVSQSFLEVQNAYLSQMVKQRGIIDCHGLIPSDLDERIFLWQGDITRLKADAVVNAANSALFRLFYTLPFLH